MGDNVVARAAPFSMKKIPAHKENKQTAKAGLYAFVYTSAFVRACVFLLLLSFVFQATDKAFANNEEADPTVVPEIVTITDELLPVVAEEFNKTQEVVLQAEAATPESSQAELGVDGLVSEGSLAEGQGSNPVDEVDVNVSDVDETTQYSNEEDTVNIGTNELDSQISTEDLASNTEATTSEQIVPTLTVESDTMIQFNKDNCLSVEDGSFYCQTATTTTAAVEEGLLSLPDADGDLEIYIKREGELHQLTFNKVDDSSPYYDPASDSIVFHRIIDERYQIITLDLASNEESQITDTSTNNMEPFRADNLIVWQHWAMDAWQIMLYDGQEVQQLTNTTEHNLAPVIRNNLIVWHRIMYGEKTIEVYDLSAKSYMTIRDDGGGTISNPRMVLVYDSVMENGDTLTRGYDLVTGEITSFDAEPKPLPEEIPSPDDTGETKALLNVKTSNEEDGQLEQDYVPDGVANSVDVSATSTSTLTLDMSASSSVATSSVAASTSTFDLVVSPLDLSTSSPTSIPVVE